MVPPTLLQCYFLPLIYLVSILALAARPGIYRTLITAPIVVLLLLQLPLRREKGNFRDEYPLGCAVLGLGFIYLDWIVLANPDKEQWHKIHGKTKEKREHDRNDGVPSTFMQRLWWAARLTVYPRGTGWSHQSKNVPDGHPADYPKLWACHLYNAPSEQSLMLILRLTLENLHCARYLEPYFSLLYKIHFVHTLHQLHMAVILEWKRRPSASRLPPSRPSFYCPGYR